MSASGPPLCRICQKEHWMRDPHILPANAPAEKRSTREFPRAEVGVELAGIRGSGKVGSANCGTRTPGANSQQNGVTATRGGKKNPKRRTPETPVAAAPKPVTNSRREGRDVLKGAKPTSTASTERPDPPTPPAKAENQTKADKVAPGKRKTAPKAKKGKKK